MKKTKSYNSLDLCKLIMSFCIIAIHTIPLVNCSNVIILNLYKGFLAFAVPFFFLTSGFLLGNKLKHPFDYSCSVSAIRKQLIKALQMYLIWSLAYLPLAVLPFIAQQRGFLLSVLEYIKRFVLIGDQYNSWQLWYLLSTIYALIYLLIVLKLKLSMRTIIVTGTALFLFGSALTCLLDYKGTLPFALVTLRDFIKSTIIYGRIFQSFFYIPVGMILSKRKVALAPAILMLLAGYTVNVIFPNTIMRQALIAVSSIGLFCVVKEIKLKDSRVYPYMRKMSTVIYFLHMYIWTFYYLIIYGKKTFGFDSFLATLSISLIISALYVFLRSRKKQKNTITQSESNQCIQSDKVDALPQTDAVT